MKTFFKNCVEIFEEFKDIGIIRLKNQNNWWKKERVMYLNLELLRIM